MEMTSVAASLQSCRMGSSAATVPVNVEGGRYDITIEPGLLNEVGDALKKLSKSKRAAVVTDSTVGPLYSTVVMQSLKAAGFEPIVAMLPAGETHKTLADLSGVYDVILGARIDRSTPVLALGGGVVGDMTGFVAATILRGVPFVQIPTTLLSMVDASVGGKTGINHAVGKNLIGAFHQPIAVLIDPAVLKTLPPGELSSGLGECIKHDIIRDADGFSRIEREIDKALALDLDYLTRLIAHNVAIKARVVEADPFEHGERAHLNLGHTFGHAIETISNYTYSHGQCVGFGMIAAARLAHDLKTLDETSVSRITATVARAGLLTTENRLSAKEVVDAMIYDKKVRAGKVRFVLPDRIGHVVIRDDVPSDFVLRAVESLRE
jgi:3-dehydroquinate synthase